MLRVQTLAQNALLTQFYQPLLNHWSKAHGFRTLCELTCRHFALVFGVEKITLAVAYKSHWKIMLDMTEAGIQFHLPPLVFPEHSDVPFHQMHKAVRQHRPALLHDIELNPEPHVPRSVVSHTQKIRLLLPLVRRGIGIGCLTVDLPDNAATRQLQEDDFLQLSTLLAAELDAFLLNASIQDEHIGRRSAERELKISLQEQQHLQQQLQTLHDISFQLWRAHSMDHMLFTAVDEAKKHLDIDRMAIFLFEEGERMQGTYGTDLQGNTVDEHYFESAIPDMWFATLTLEQKEYLAIEENTPLYHDLKQVGFGWSAYVSLWDEDTPIGWIACDNLLSGMPLRDYHRQILKQFGFIVSQHLVRRRAEEQLIRLNTELEQRVSERTQALLQANEKLEKISRQDPLTEVANRRVFDEMFAEEWRRAERHQLPLSLLIMDVDHFKHYNDSYGHAAGDHCLKTLAKALSSLERRAGALFARYGGEEFVLLLPGQDQQAARYAAKRALYAVQALQLPRENGADSAPDIVTISIGVSTIIPSSCRTPGDFFKQADLALYEAKSKGRNQLFVA